MIEPIVIQTNWTFALGLFGTLIVLAWYGAHKFSKLETDMDWVKDSLKDLLNEQRVARDNKRLKVIGNASPLRLLEPGLKVLNESGIKEYIDSNETSLHKQCKHNCDLSAYEIQENIFELFDNLTFDTVTDKKFKDYAYKEGMNMETVRRIGAIYFRDKCLSACNLAPSDVDATKPAEVTA